MAEQGEYGGPSFGGVGAYGEGLSEEEKEYSNAIARNILGISTNPATYGAPLDSPEAANYGFGLGSNLSSISPNLAKYASPFLNPSTGQAQFDQGFFDFSGIEGAKKANELGFGPQLAQLGLAQAIPGYTKNINFPAIMGQHLSPVAYGTKQQQQAVLKSMYDDKEISLQDAIKYGALVNHMNPNLGTLNVNPDNLNIESYTEAVLAGLPGMSTNVTFGNTNPNQPFKSVIEMIDPVNTTPTVSPAGNAILDHFGIDQKHETPQEDIDALMDDVLGVDLGVFDLDNALAWNPAKVSPNILQNVEPSVEQMLEWNPPQFDTKFNTNFPNPALSPEARKSDLEATNEALDAMGYGPLSQMDQDVLGLDRAMVSTDFDPWGGLVTSSISHSDTEREYAERAAAERALYSQIVQQLAPVEPLNPPDRVRPAATPAARPAARPVARPAGRQAANAPAPVRHDPIANLVRTVLSPKINQVNPAAVKAIKKGKKPDYTMMTDYQQDLVRELLNPQDSSHRAPKPTYARMDDR